MLYGRSVGTGSAFTVTRSAGNSDLSKQMNGNQDSAVGQDPDSTGIYNLLHLRFISIHPGLEVSVRKAAMKFVDNVFNYTSFIIISSVLKSRLSHQLSRKWRRRDSEGRKVVNYNPWVRGNFLYMFCTEAMWTYLTLLDVTGTETLNLVLTGLLPTLNTESSVHPLLACIITLYVI